MASNDPVVEYLYPEDVTGFAATNLVKNERQTLNPPELAGDSETGYAITFHFSIPFATPYFRDSLNVKHISSGRLLVPNIDYTYGHQFQAASYETQNIRGGIYASILFFDSTLSGQIELEYQTLGGNWTLNENKIFEILANRLVDPRSVSFEVVSGKPEVFPPLDHNQPADDFTGMKEMLVAVAALEAVIRERTQTWLDNPPILFDLYFKKSEINTKFSEVSARFNQYYTAQEIDEKLRELIENGGGGGTGPGTGEYYTKGEVNLLINGIRNTFNNYYTKTQVDDQLTEVWDKLGKALTTDDIDAISADIADGVIVRTDLSLAQVVDTFVAAFESGIATLGAR